MKLLTTGQAHGINYLSEQRKHQRHEAINLVAITERGTGQVLDINREGLSFGCLYPHTFPREFHIDILEEKGSHIKRLKVRKMRETSGDEQEAPAPFEVVLGVEFADLTPSQAGELEHLLDKNMKIFVGLVQSPSPTC